jgi:hypothetical protein
VVPEPTLLVWTWSLPPYAQITPEKMLDKIAKAKNRLVISTTAFTLQPVIDMLKSSQAGVGASGGTSRQGGGRDGCGG